MKFNEVELEVTPTGDHRQWFMTADEVARGYGVARNTVMTHLAQHATELRDGIERGVGIADTLGGPQEVTTLYRDGVIKMGFFIRSRKSADFRQWATNVVMLHMDGQNADVKNMLVSMQGHMDNRFSALESRMDEIQGEVDELRALVNMTLSDTDEKEIRELLAKVKAKTGMDGRAIVGNVRATIGSSGIYNTPNLALVKNVLRNMLGFGIQAVP